MTKKAFITGINGQDGSYLTEFLLEKDYEVHGIIRRSSVINTERIDHLMENSDIFGKKLFVHYGDLTDSSNINSLISTIKPDEIYNLAAQSHVKVSFEIPEYSINVAGLGCLRLLDAMKQHCPNSKFYQASTSEMFGGQKDEMPITGFTETTPFHPRSPYGCGKLLAYWIVKNYREAYNSFACNGLLFNHESSRRGINFISRKITTWFAKYVYALQNNQELPKLYIGNINAYRDWGHAKDYIEAQWLMLQQDKPDDFVIATGETHTVREFLEICLSYINKKIVWKGRGIEEKGYIDNIPIINVSEKYFRPSEVDILLGDPTKAKTVLGWKPKYSFNDLIKEMMVYDLKLAGVTNFGF